MPNNQTEQEYFAVVATGRKGLEEMAEKMSGELMAIAAKSVADAGPTWLKRAIVSIANNDNLADVLKTKAGLFSVYKALSKAATMGLQIGGQFPQVHLTPYDGKVELIVSAEGYKHTAVHGPGAVLSDVVIRRVYEGEKVKIDVGAGKVDHVIDVTASRGKLAGVYGIITRSDGKTEVDYMTREEALRIRDAHSRGYAAFKAGRIKSNFWVTDEDAAIEKTAAKKFLRKYAAESEGLAMLYGQDDKDDEPTAYDHPPCDVSDRMAGRLDTATDRLAPGPAAPAVEEEPIEAKAEVIDNKPDSAGDLF